MSQAAVDDRIVNVRKQLDQAGQGHILEQLDRIDPGQQQELLREIVAVDWPEVARLVQSHVLAKPEFHLPEHLMPAPWYPSSPGGDLSGKYREARAQGEQMIRDGKVAAFTVAGGQGTRLGWDGPKGSYPATPIRKTSLFGCFAEYLVKVGQKYGTTVPWYVMTSPINDVATREFFEQQDYFGLDRDSVMLFPQAMMPALDMNNGRVLFGSPSGLALSPNGHGGSLKALYTSGAIADMRRRGVEQISYIQVDNPNVRVVDPLFLGLHAGDDCQMSSKMVPKVDAHEKLGNFCLADSRLSVIEYSDLPDEQAERRGPDGELLFKAGSIAIHVIRVDFVERLNAGQDEGSSFALPYHRAEKKVPYYDPATGTQVQPDSPNAVKLETFVFDALPLCDRSIVYETDRVEEFAPIKNADGTDSADSSRRLQVERAARWLEARGVKVPRTPAGEVEVLIEIQPSTAIESDDLPVEKLPAELKGGDELLL